MVKNGDFYPELNTAAINEDFVDEEDLEVNATKKIQLRQQLLDNRADGYHSLNQAGKSKKTKKSRTQRDSSKLEMLATNLVWLLYVLEFFEIDTMCQIERRKALRLERFLCNVRRT